MVRACGQPAIDEARAASARQTFGADDRRAIDATLCAFFALVVTGNYARALAYRRQYCLTPLVAQLFPEMVCRLESETWRCLVETRQYAQAWAFADAQLADQCIAPWCVLRAAVAPSDADGGGATCVTNESPLPDCNDFPDYARALAMLVVRKPSLQLHYLAASYHYANFCEESLCEYVYERYCAVTTFGHALFVNDFHALASGVLERALTLPSARNTRLHKQLLAIIRRLLVYCETCAACKRQRLPNTNKSPPPFARALSNQRLARCRGCYQVADPLVWYCTMDCQRAHWPEHRRVCPHGRRNDDAAAGGIV